MDTAYHTRYRNFVAQFRIFLALPILYCFLKQVMDYKDVFHFIQTRFGQESYLLAKSLWMVYQWWRMGIVLYIPSVMFETMTSVSAYFWMLVITL